MKKLVIIPAYNESESILNTINEIKKKAPEFYYVIINDASKDNTLDILKKNKLNYINLPANLGIGGAVQTGYLYAEKNEYDIAVQIDGDGQHDPAYLDILSEALISHNADMVIGSRFIENEGFQSTFMRRLGITYFSFLIRLLTGVRVTDPTSGFRMVNRNVIKLFACDYPVDYPEPESTVQILKKKMKVEEVPVKMLARAGGESSIKPWNSVYYMIKVSLAILIECTRKHEVN